MKQKGDWESGAKGGGGAGGARAEVWAGGETYKALWHMGRWRD